MTVYIQNENEIGIIVSVVDQLAPEGTQAISKQRIAPWGQGEYPNITEDAYGKCWLDVFIIAADEMGVSKSFPGQQFRKDGVIFVDFRE